jgi:hypothetical protein
MAETTGIYDESTIDNDAVIDDPQRTFSKEINNKLVDRKHSRLKESSIRKATAQELLERAYFQPDPQKYFNPEPKEEDLIVDKLMSDELKCIYSEIEKACGDWDEEGEVSLETWERALLETPIVID